MSLHDVSAPPFDFFSQKPVQAELVDEHLSSDGGLLIFRQFDQQQQLTESFAQQIEEHRNNPNHSILEMVRSRVFGILAGYEDQNDHDALRTDAVFKLIADCSPDEDDLASQPTLSRFENAVDAESLLRLEEWFIERFVDTFDEPPREITLDIDVFDDPTHGQQQLTFFHGFYKQYQYLARVITCAENDRVILPALMHGTADAALGADLDVRRIVHALREKFPDVLIHLRADSGYAKPQLYRECEQLQIEYSIGYQMNAVIKRRSDALLETAKKQYEESGESQRLFTRFEYRAQSWMQPRCIVVKCEYGSAGGNRRAIVCNRSGVRTLPQGAYEEYAERGESENRNKELKCDLHADRLSNHRVVANIFRLMLHCLAANMLVLLRRHIANPPNPETPLPPEVLADDPQQADVPPESRSGRARRHGFNHRRRFDPLGEGHASTWRTRLIKVAARIQVTARRVRVFLSSSWPFVHHFEALSRVLLTGT